MSAKGTDRRRRAQRADQGRVTRPPPTPPGLAARDLAVTALAGVLNQGRTLEDALAPLYAPGADLLPARDRGFVRLIVATALRRKGEIDAVLAGFLAKPLDQKRGRIYPIMVAAATQLLMLDTPAHAAIGLAVDQCKRDRNSAHFAGLANAVLRRVSSEGRARLADFDGPALNVPAWLLARWRSTYGTALAQEVAAASLREAGLDLSVKSDAPGWAERLGGVVLPTGSVRLTHAGRIEDLEGYAEGAWWVQDAAAALPVLALGDVGGLEIADLCAAPGGKTALLAQRGAKVTAVDVSAGRMARLEETLRRVRLDAELVTADAATWAPGRAFNAVLVDAPCTATGTIRRHPDILHLKRPSDIAEIAGLQARILDHAAGLVRPGGRLVFCTCSLEPEEGQDQVTRFLERHDGFRREPIVASDIGGEPGWITDDGDIRTLPVHLALAPPVASGLDGFFVARLRRTG